MDRSTINPKASGNAKLAKLAKLRKAYLEFATSKVCLGPNSGSSAYYMPFLGAAAATAPLPTLGFTMNLNEPLPS
jgi:hypothetical protein